jgi:hypothetical protein
VAREYLWTDDGIADARRNKIDLAEAVHALYAPPGLRYERMLGDLLLIVMGLADTGRVIAVLCDRDEASQAYHIIAVRPVEGRDLDEWRRRVR